MNAYTSLPAGYLLADRYRVEHKLGSGRSSAVYRALDAQTGTRVALKVLDPFLAADPLAIERFRREVDVLAALDHPHIVKVIDYLPGAEFTVIVMQWIDGADVKNTLRAHGRFEIQEVLKLAGSALSALEACHRRGVLHRDLKPQNLILDQHGEVFLVDFGISKINSMSDLTKTGTALGTPEYMAPELFVSATGDPRSDLYALGAVLYELLTGDPPVRGTTLASVMAQHLSGDFPSIVSLRPDAPPWLASVIAKCLRRDPAERFQSAAGVAAELERAEQALCVVEERNEPIRCLACDVEMVPGLSFCHDCGRFTREIFERGRHAVVLYRTDQPADLGRYLRALFPGLSERAVRRRLRFPPVVLFDSIGEATASGLCNELAACHCEIGVSDRLPTALRLPPWLVILAFVLPAMIFFGAYVGLADRLGIGLGVGFQGMIGASFAASLGTLVALYRVNIRPLVSRRHVFGRAKTQPPEIAQQMVAAIRTVRSASRRRSLGVQASHFFQIYERHGAVSGAEELVLSSFRAAAALDRYEIHLGGRSLMTIAEERDRVAVQLEAEQETDRLRVLVERKTDLEMELREYQEIQDRHGQLATAILSAGGTLEKLRNSLDAQLPTGDAGAIALEVRELTEELDGWGLQARGV